MPVRERTDWEKKQMQTMNEIIQLICMTEAPDENGIPEEKKLGENQVFAYVNSIKRQEFYAAEREGIKLAVAMYVNADDFKESAIIHEGKKVYPSQVKYEGNIYKIFRTYQESGTSMELILQEVV